MLLLRLLLLLLCFKCASLPRQIEACVVGSLKPPHACGVKCGASLAIGVEGAQDEV